MGRQNKNWHVIRLQVLARDLYICTYCLDDATTVDHMIPRSRGGTNAQRNLVACCSWCNSSKRDLTPAEWFARDRIPRFPPWFLETLERIQ